MVHRTHFVLCLEPQGIESGHRYGSQLVQEPPNAPKNRKVVPKTHFDPSGEPLSGLWRAFYVPPFDNQGTFLEPFDKSVELIILVCSP